jgi:hypothetical protein
VVTVISAASPCIRLPFLATVNVLVSKVLATSRNLIVSPTAGLAGRVAVTAPPVVLTKYPPYATAAKLLAVVE